VLCVVVGHSVILIRHLLILETYWRTQCCDRVLARSWGGALLRLRYGQWHKACRVLNIKLQRVTGLSLGAEFPTVADHHGHGRVIREQIMFDGDFNEATALNGHGLVLTRNGRTCRLECPGPIHKETNSDDSGVGSPFRHRRRTNRFFNPYFRVCYSAWIATKKVFSPLRTRKRTVPSFPACETAFSNSSAVVTS
jgi:hypothetical protein